MENILNELRDQLVARGQDPDNYLRGLKHNRAINYWDYVMVDTLLSLQHPRTHFKDETIFIVYHQITELVLKLIRHELEQLTEDDIPGSLFIEKIHRMVRYTDLLSSSFSIMTRGMSYEDYNQFRLSLAPASGFQSAQFRFIEILCTDIDLLIPSYLRDQIDEQTSLERKFALLYWQEAGYNRQTQQKTKTLTDFEERYLHEFQRMATKMKHANLRNRYKQVMETLGEDDKKQLVQALRAFDAKYNIEWPMVHLETARTYLLSKGEAKSATGGSHWEKYLHPQFQRRIYFPELWSQEELDNWGKE